MYLQDVQGAPVCVRCVQEVCMCAICAQDVCKMCARCVQDVWQVCARCAQDLCKMCSICVQDVCKVCVRCVQGELNVCPRYMHICHVWYHWAPRKYSTCWVLEKSEEPCRILKKCVHACVVNVIHAKVLLGSVLYIEHWMKVKVNYECIYYRQDLKKWLVCMYVIAHDEH